MDYLEFLFAGFAVFWAGLLVYLLWLQARLRSVQQEMQRLEERLLEAERESRGATPRDTTSRETSRMARGTAQDATADEREPASG